MLAILLFQVWGILPKTSLVVCCANYRVGVLMPFEILHLNNYLEKFARNNIATL